MIELLAPARDVRMAVQAILAGADAVYIGAYSHGARQSAPNSIEDIKSVVDLAHVYNARVYVTVNTLVFESEIPKVEALIRQLYRIGVDALIVQDLGVLRMNIPPVELHASTQCDIRTPAKASFLKALGLTRVVVARELSLQEMAEIARIGVEVEAFCHGALCVSYSGDCRASFLTTGRSANRGECAQLCRLKYQLIDDRGVEVHPASHFLSLRDLNRIDSLGDMVDAGVSSFKIEGRLKDTDYVVDTVTAYSEALDKIALAKGLRRQSFGKTIRFADADLSKCFNRGFTLYFTLPVEVESKMASIRTPKWAGQYVGKVKRLSADGKVLTLDCVSDVLLTNGDGLTFFDDYGNLNGFRVNRADGDTVYVQEAVKGLKAGKILYRNYFKLHQDILNAHSPQRKLRLDCELRLAASQLVLEMRCENGNRIAVTQQFEEQTKAKTPQAQQRQKAISKLGDTPFVLNSLDDQAGDVFIPASALTTIRRKAVAAMLSAMRMTYRFSYRNAEDANADVELPENISYRENVANSLAERVYSDHGAKTVERAIEVSNPNDPRRIVAMETRYCIRRELGMCLKEKTTTHRRPLSLIAPGIRFDIEFDCARCGIKLYKR